MLDCQANANTTKEGETIECKYCQETGDTVGTSQTVYWGIQLDQDLLETIVSIYPEWFKNYNLGSVSGSGAGGGGAMAEGYTNALKVSPATTSSSSPSSSSSPLSSSSSSSLSATLGLPPSPPKAEVDETPIHKSMDKHKQSLKVKLLLRRPINQLVDQGIMPPLRTPPAFHEQRQKLERAKMGDLLKSKIQRRPDRQELIQQHILEDSNVAPSLQDKQRQLKKARLADDLNERLSHRPGPLELVEGNILQTDECFAQAVRGGQITFKKTCEGETRKHPPPLFVYEEDSSSGEAGLSPLHDSDQSQVGSVQSPCPAEAAVLSSAIGSPGLGSAASSLSPVSSVASPTSSFTQSPVAGTAGIGSQTLLQHASSCSPSLATTTTGPTPALVPLSAPTKLNLVPSSSPPTRPENARPRKKSKSKSSPKTRTIKFHEYKGPPNAQKMQASNASSVESSYELLLQQQQLFLQWQLEWQHKYPQIILPASQDYCHYTLQKTNGNESPANLMSPTSFANSYPGQVLNGCSQSQPDCTIRFISKLEDMKVSDLKAECKRRNLPVSGSKPQLIERLKPFSDMTSSTGGAILLSASSPMSDPSSSHLPSTCNNQQVTVGQMLLEGGQTSSGAADCAPNEESLSMTPLEAASSPTSPPGVNNSSSLTAALLSDSMDSMDSIPSGQYHSPAGSSGGGSGPPSLQRPPSAAPMDVDACALDAMEVGEVERNLSFVDPTTIAAAVAMFGANGVQETESEEKLRKKIEALQQELQKSQMELQQRQRKQALLGHQTPPHTPQTPPPCNSAVPQDVKPNIASMQPLTDQKLQQKLMLQQHLQQRMQHQLLQQQQQQQQQALQMIRPQSASSPAKANLAAFLQGNANAVQQHQQKQQQFFNFGLANNNNNNNNNNVNNSNGSSQQQQQVYDEAGGNKQRTTTLPNGLGHIRTNSLPNFLGTDGSAQKVPVTRASTDLQIVITQPPPDYDEATKQLNKQQFAQTLINTLANPQSGRKSFKSQAVDDVLEILIKNGELPPSAAQEPPTPPTPKSLPSGLIVFPSSTQSTLTGCTTTSSLGGTPVSRTQSLPLRSPSRSPSQTHPTVVGVLNGTTSCGMSPHGHRKHSSDGDLDSPGSICHPPPSLDLDFNLDLEGLEPMNLESLPREDGNGHHKGELLSGLVNGGGGSSDQGNHHLHDMLDLNDTMHMDIDWLENVIPGDELSALGNSAVTSVVAGGGGGGSADCGDPLLSTNQDPFDLFSIDENDFKSASDLSTLGWDKADFAT